LPGLCTSVFYVKWASFGCVTQQRCFVYLCCVFCVFSCYSWLVSLQSTIHQHSWNSLVITPTTTVDVFMQELTTYILDLTAVNTHLVSHYLAIIIIYPCSDLNINFVVILPSLILFLHRRLPCENINGTSVYSLGKILHRYIRCACRIVLDSKYSCSIVILLRYV
jgi:hypothetical protein